MPGIVLQPDDDIEDLRHRAVEFIKRRNEGLSVMEIDGKRWAKCEHYLRNNRSMPEAQAAAKRDGISYNTSVWITAMSKMLVKGFRPGDLIGKT